MIQHEMMPGVHPSWYPVMGYVNKDPMLVQLRDEILPNTPFRPAKEDIFKVFRMPVDKISVVILGQD